MKLKHYTHNLLAVLPFVALCFTSCSTTPQVDEETTAIETPDGAIIVDTYTMTATVTGIDSANRKITLVSPNGAKTTFKAGPEVANFNQIQVGDQVKAAVTEEAAVVFRSAGTPASAAVTKAVALAPLGAKPGVMLADSREITATITAVDLKNRKATLQLPDGTSKTVKVGKVVDLSAVKVGEAITIQLSEGLMITVAKP